MAKLGLFDPRSLKRKDGYMQIHFVSALDVQDIEVVDIRSSAQADAVISQLEAQQNSIDYPLLALGHEMIRLKGLIAMPGDNPGKGMIAVRAPSGQREIISVEADFPIKPNDLPSEGVGFASGYMVNGTLHAYQIAMKALRPAPNAQQPSDTMVGAT